MIEKKEMTKNQLGNQIAKIVHQSIHTNKNCIQEIEVIKNSDIVKNLPYEVNQEVLTMCEKAIDLINQIEKSKNDE